MYSVKVKIVLNNFNQARTTLFKIVYNRGERTVSSLNSTSQTKGRKILSFSVSWWKNTR